MRARVWHRIDIGHRAALRVVEWIVQKGGEHLVSRIKRSRIVSTMVRKAAQRLIDLLGSVARKPTFKVRAMLEGVYVACERIASYRERRVLAWAPWIKEWLGRRDTVYYLGSTSIGWPPR